MTTPPATGNWITGAQTVWRSHSNGTPRPRLRVAVVDRARSTVTFPVRVEDASDAFVHPFGYAETSVCGVA